MAGRSCSSVALSAQLCPDYTFHTYSKLLLGQAPSNAIWGTLVVTLILSFVLGSMKTKGRVD
jgi:hypothetical protein